MTTTCSTGPVLVTATVTGAPTEVVLADASYATDAERVFRRGGTDVLRVPLDAAVDVRPVHRPAATPSDEGVHRLLAALAPHRRATTDDAVPAPRPATGAADPVQERLAAALSSGQVGKAESLVALVWRRESLAAAHQALATCLAGISTGTGGHVVQLTAAAGARAVLERLRALSPEPSTGVGGAGRQVVLAVPPGDPHTLALAALAHQLQEAGHPVLVVDQAPTDQLAALVARDEPLAVVLSAHLPWSTASARAHVGALRAAGPGTLLVVGGPGAPRSVPRADVVTDDPGELLEALRTRSRALSPREREVLLAVADGLTTNEIAEELGLSPATVRTHLDHVFAKTGTEHRAAAVARALRRGWIT